MKKYILILPLLICFIHISFAQNRKAEMEIDALLDKLMQTYNAYDGETIKSLMTDDAFATVIQGGMVYKPDFYDQITPEKVSEKNISNVSKWVDKSIRVVDGQSAVALCTIQSTTTLQDQEPSETKTTNTIVMEKKSGKWRIATMHISSITENRNF